MPKEYTYIKKSKSEVEMDKIVNNIAVKLWKDSEYASAYYLGAVTQLKMFAECLKKHDYLGRHEILMVMDSFKTNNDAPDEIKKLVDIILDEFDYKEENK